MSTVKNTYPNLPVEDFKRTSISIDEVKSYLISLDVPLEVKRSAYMIFRNESGNGKHGVNNNYTGVQADGNKLGHGFDEKVIATVVMPENATKKPRRFAIFETYKGSIDYLASRIYARGIYIGGKTNSAYSKIDVTTPERLAVAYYKEWVAGSITAEIPITQKNCYISLYKSAVKAIK